MTQFRLRAATPGSGPSLTLRNARMPRAGAEAKPVDIVIDDGRVSTILPAGSVAAEGETLDVDGRFVLPGLVDHHVHFTQWAQRSRRLDVSSTRSAAELAARVSHQFALGQPADGILVAFGFRDALWPDVPDRGMLDRATGGHPVVAIAADLHSVWLNSAAMSRFGHTSEESGLLREENAFSVLRALDTVPLDVLDAWALDAAEAAAARGVVGIVDFEMAWNLEAWQRRGFHGHTLLRVEFGIYPGDLDRAIGEHLQTGQVVAHTHGLVRVGPLKVITDGSLGTRTAWCFDAYPDDEGSYGVETVPIEDLVELMSRADRAGIRSAIHAIGDRANRAALDAFAETGASGTLEHAQLLSEADIARFASLPVVASVQPEHANDDRDIAEHHWHGRTSRAYPLRSILDEGGTLALGSDAPVAPLDPWVAIAAGVFRSRDGREPWHPEQRITVAEAIAASTHNGTTAARPGDVADLILVDHDPYTADIESLRTMSVAATMLGGRFTHRAI